MNEVVDYNAFQNDQGSDFADATDLVMMAKYTRKMKLLKTFFRFMMLMKKYLKSCRWTLLE